MLDKNRDVINIKKNVLNLILNKGFLCIYLDSEIDNNNIKERFGILII